MTFTVVSYRGATYELDGESLARAGYINSELDEVEKMFNEVYQDQKDFIEKWEKIGSTVKNGQAELLVYFYELVENPEQYTRPGRLVRAIIRNICKKMETVEFFLDKRLNTADTPEL